MEDVFLSTPISDHRVLCISPLSARTYKEGGGKGLGGDFGYFIYEVDSENPQSGIEIIAKAASFNAALRLYNIIASATSTQNVHPQLHETADADQERLLPAQSAA